MSEPSHAEAVAPERASWIESDGLRLRLHEWGDPQATPVLLCHGMFDHGRGFDMLAPRLARRFRVLAVVGSVPDTWGPLPEFVLDERLAHVPRVERATIEGAGHFVHMERPVETAELLLAWLDP